MPLRHRFGLVSASVLAAMIELQSPIAQAQSKIGVAASVSNQVEVGTRPLARGNDVHANDRVRTGDAGAAQLLFIDETSLSIGPRSDVTLDRFVYNPDRGTGSVVLSATRGAFRFVSGSQNPVNYTLKTPAATIGVRGTVVQGQVGPTQSTFYVVQGAIVWNGITIPAGWAITVYADGTYHGPYKYDSASIPGWGNMGRAELPDGRNDLVDQLFGIDLRNQPPRCTGKCGTFSLGNRGR
jgi:hypothetical protein